MDTDDLSKNTYEAVLIEAEKFHHDLTLQFGVLAGSCKNEEEYLNAAEIMIKNWLEDWQTKEAMADIFFDRIPEESEFIRVLEKIRGNIIKVRRIPLKKRKFEEW